MTLPTFQIVDQTKTKKPTAEQLALMQAGAQAWMERIDTVWNVAGNLVTLSAGTGTIPVYLVDTLPEAPGALAYHSIDENGRAFVKVGCQTIFENGGTDWTFGALSILSAICHELGETSQDVGCNGWELVGKRLIAREICDPVQDQVISLSVNGQTVTCSNAVTPAFFIEGASGPFDLLSQLTEPGQLSRGGYMVTMTPGKTSQVEDETGATVTSLACVEFGENVPENIKAAKLVPGTRANARLLAAAA